MRSIYLDYNATTPIAPHVQESMLPFLAEQYGNPSSDHALGRASHEAVEAARGQVAALLGAARDEIVFTSGGTEANNLALVGTALRRMPEVRGHLIISAVEHPAIVAPARFLERFGFDVTVVGTDERGVIDLRGLAAAFRPDTFLVSVMHANNEIGTVQPIAEIAALCRESNVLLHTDAAQTVGKLPVDVTQLHVDLLSIAGHKMYAPKGVGALYVRRGVALEPVLHGAGHEQGLRPGTENVASIVGLGRAAEVAHRTSNEAAEHFVACRDLLLARLRDAMGERLTVNGAGAERLPNTLSVNIPGVVGQALLERTPEMCASTGSACHSGSNHLSATLASIGLEPQVAAGTVRFSVGWYTSEEDIHYAADALIGAWESLR